MGRTRVYELAKELGLDSKRVVDLLQEMGAEVKNHMSNVEDDAVERLRERLSRGVESQLKSPSREAGRGAGALHGADRRGGQLQATQGPTSDTGQRRGGTAVVLRQPGLGQGSEDRVARVPVSGAGAVPRQDTKPGLSRTGPASSSPGGPAGVGRQSPPRRQAPVVGPRPPSNTIGVRMVSRSERTQGRPGEFSPGLSGSRLTPPGLRTPSPALKRPGIGPAPQGDAGAPVRKGFVPAKSPTAEPGKLAAGVTSRVPGGARSLPPSPTRDEAVPSGGSLARTQAPAKQGVSPDAASPATPPSVERAPRPDTLVETKLAPPALEAEPAQPAGTKPAVQPSPPVERADHVERKPVRPGSSGFRPRQPLSQERPARPATSPAGPPETSRRVPGGGLARPGSGPSSAASARPPLPKGSPDSRGRAVRDGGGRPPAQAGRAGKPGAEKRPASGGRVEAQGGRMPARKVVPFVGSRRPGSEGGDSRFRRPGAPRSGRMAPRGKPEKVAPLPVRKDKVEIAEAITVRELAGRLGLAASVLIKKLMELGVMATINQSIEGDAAALLAQDLGIKVERPKTQEATLLVEPEDSSENLEPRSPVVTIMGHVDHGKTSLLDSIRKTKVAAGEAGGITQHIGAYQVEAGNKKITFVDTPGHEAFTAMRSRGAQITDVAVLVVAADDGVMPQTIEAINHAKAAGVPIVVAVNKVDKAGANIDRVKQQLSEQGLVPDDWGGDTVMVPVSALRHEGIKTLLEMILLVAEMRDLKANPARRARGTVVEAQLDKGRGPVATVLVQAGTLRVGDPIIVGSVAGKVRAMQSDTGKPVQEAGPSTPVEVLGLPDVPKAGDILIALSDEKSARTVAEERREKLRVAQLQPSARMTLEDLFDKVREGELKELRVVLKADVQGSLEALQPALEKASTEEVRVNVIHAGVGGITESDINLAAASDAIIIGFSVRPDANAQKAAEREKVETRLYRVIYEAIDDVKAAIQGLLEPTFREAVLGHAEVRALFKVPGVGTVAGCYVTDGNISRNASIRVLRDNVVVHDGKIGSLKRFKEDVREVAEGYECGISLERWNDVKEGDVIEAFEMERVETEAKSS
ncbi:MAG: translation initiation factor IF-2 [Firmicutes bacterium]|nr:translation initiation factor IF-2 [Bacillota bacterium]